MNKKSETGMNIMQAEQYESPHVKVIELEIEDAVLTGTPSMPNEDWFIGRKKVTNKL